MSRSSPPPPGAGSPCRAAVRGILLGLLGVAVVGLAVLLAAWLSACAGNACPSLAGLDDYDPAQASKVYAADGRLITDLGLERRTVVPLTQMSPAVVRAFLATEDKRFYEHGGIDWVRVAGALKGALRGPAHRRVHHHDAARRQPLPRGHQPPRSAPSAASSARCAWRSEIEKRSTRRTRSSSCT